MDCIKAVETVLLWEEVETEEIPCMHIYFPKQKTANCAILIFPGGGYEGRAVHEGASYAEFFASRGILSVVVDYRVFPNFFPTPLQDAQRALQLLRYNAHLYGIDKNKVAVMGSSAGAHLASLLSTYREFIAVCDDDVSRENFLPNAQILCYGVLTLSHTYAHKGSAKKLLGGQIKQLDKALSPILMADEETPQAFLWHTLADSVVPVENSLEYVKTLRKQGVKAELHIFPDGEHGLGLSLEDNAICRHNAQWKDLLLHWLHYIQFIN